MESLGHYEALERASRQAGDSAGLAYALRHLAELQYLAHEGEISVGKADEAVELLRRDQPDRALDLANALRVRALGLSLLGRVDDERSAWREARALYVQVGVEDGVAECDQHLSD